MRCEVLHFLPSLQVFSTRAPACPNVPVQLQSRASHGMTEAVQWLHIVPLENCYLLFSDLSSCQAQVCLGWLGPYVPVAFLHTQQTSLSTEEGS